MPLKSNKLNIECIIFHNKRIIPHRLTHIKIANSEIEIKTDITTIGVKLDKHLLLNNQMSSTIKQTITIKTNKTPSEANFSQDNTTIDYIKAQLDYRNPYVTLT